VLSLGRTLQTSTLELNNRALAYVGLKKYDKADSDYSEVLRLAPEDPMAYNNRAWLAATCPDGAVRNGIIALEDATKACELSHWKEANFLDTFAAACAENNRFAEAVKWKKKALEDSQRMASDRRRCLAKDYPRLLLAHCPILFDPVSVHS
jgi:tetratricopeptide (TPR) repeat protein